MGKRYLSELKLLADTYAWSMKVDIDPLAGAIASSASLPLLATGSGGSLVAADFASFLHHKYAGVVAKAVTPLELVDSILSLRNVAILLLSAGGRNTDIIGAFKRVVERDPRHIIVMCFSPKSPLSQLAENFRHVHLIDLDHPLGKDGFLATNSLLAFMVVLCRGYAKALSQKNVLPKTLKALVYPTMTKSRFVNDLRNRCAPLWDRETLVVLYGTSSKSAAMDLESKFTEAALGTIQISDYRNFAHGRHNWLAKRGSETAVLALVTDDDRKIADKTLRLIPRDIPVQSLDISSNGARASIAALVSTLYVIGFAGEAREIDPGRPGVPLFGRKIYNLRAFPKIRNTGSSLRQSEALAIERKASEAIESLMARGELDFWRKAYKSFTQNLKKVTFSAIVFDYDGTLCDTRDRYEGARKDIVLQLKRLLNAGILVGIATGRGKSVKKDLRNKLPKGVWPRVVIGYYNGAENGLLSDDSCPKRSSRPCDALRFVFDAIKLDSRLSRLSKCGIRRMQITVEPKLLAHRTLVWNMLEQVTNEFSQLGVTLVRSSHSIDVLAPGVSKKALVTKVRELIGGDESGPVLCIGDQGRWPGNDFDLLREPHSLSVDEVSIDPQTCWNLAPTGYRGVQATLTYLDAIKFLEGAFRIDVSKIKDVRV